MCLNETIYIYIYMSTLPPSGIFHILKTFKIQSLHQDHSFYFQKSCSLKGKALLIPKSFFMLNRPFLPIKIFLWTQSQRDLRDQESKLSLF